MRTKSPTNCDAHLAESLFQTRSSMKPPPSTQRPKMGMTIFPLLLFQQRKLWKRSDENDFIQHSFPPDLFLSLNIFLHTDNSQNIGNRA
ncbi:MAG: DUF6783 domain-containing protein [Blautia faecis]